MNFKFFFILTVEMLHRKIQSLCNFFSLKIVKTEPTKKVQSFFPERDALVPVKNYLSYLSLH
jgi:hypothetical protein